MTDPDFIMLYVDNPAISAAFYENLLGKQPVESSPTFAMFILSSGVKLGLWSKHDVEPTAQSAISGSELVFTAQDNHRVDAMYADWRERGLPIAQLPTQMDFGYTFVALDPDGHRLRVYARAISPK